MLATVGVNRPASAEPMKPGILLSLLKVLYRKGGARCVQICALLALYIFKIENPSSLQEWAVHQYWHSGAP